MSDLGAVGVKPKEVGREAKKIDVERRLRMATLCAEKGASAWQGYVKDLLRGEERKSWHERANMSTFMILTPQTPTPYTR